MPIEQRSLVFSTVEFLSAIMLYNKKRGGKLYALTDVRKVDVEAASRNNTTHLIMSDGEHLQFSEADLLAALISYCIDKHIPLPMRASKKLHTTDEGVTLKIAEWNRRIAPTRTTQVMA